MASLVVLDVDGTLTKVRSSWQYLHEKLGIWDSNAERYQGMFRRGEINYHKFCELDAGLWAGIALEDVEALIDTIQYRDHIEEFFASLKGKGIKVALVSTGIYFLVNRVNGDFDLDYAFSNHLLHDGDHLTGRVKVEVDWDDKPKIVRRLKRELGVKKEDVAVFGDSDGDLGMFDAGGICIAVEPSSCSLKGKAHHILADGDLREGARILREESKNV